MIFLIFFVRVSGGQWFFPEPPTGVGSHNFILTKRGGYAIFSGLRKVHPSPCHINNEHSLKKQCRAGTTTESLSYCSGVGKDGFNLFIYDWGLGHVSRIRGHIHTASQFKTPQAEVCTSAQHHSLRHQKLEC